MTKNRQSLYLDFYPAITHPETGKPTRREFLGMHVFDKPKNPPDKEHNREITALAENIRSQRQVMIAKQDYGFLVSRVQSTDFLAWFRRWTYRFEGSYLDTVKTALRYLETYAKGELRTDQVNERFLKGFREWLLTANALKWENHKISQNSASTWFGVVKSAVTAAYNDADLFPVNYAEKVEGIPQRDSQRKYLSLEELQQLAKTECDTPVLKRAALFSALTGLRYCDIERLTWLQTEYSEAQGHFIRFRQQKTDGAETMPISEQAASLLGTPGNPSEKVFAGLKYDTRQNAQLKYWIALAGIRKKITFHCFRHTYATLQLSLGTDLYTVSKMLGHKDISVTQIYAKVMDKAKREAADKIKLEL